jgi:hypothetical protein
MKAWIAFEEKSSSTASMSRRLRFYLTFGFSSAPHYEWSAFDMGAPRGG